MAICKQIFFTLELMNFFLLALARVEIQKMACACPAGSTTRNALRGVTFERRTRKWRARLYANEKHVTLGRFASHVLAAKAHDCAACFVFGDDAITNYGLGAARQELERVLAAEQARKPPQQTMYASRLTLVRAEYHRRLQSPTGYKGRVGEPCWMLAHRHAAAALATESRPDPKLVTLQRGRRRANLAVLVLAAYHASVNRGQLAPA
jgi:hypothetical protein